MREEQLDTYAKVKEKNGITTYFRKFDIGTWIFQFNEKGEHIGSACISNDTLDAINQAPSIQAGDGKTVQLKGTTK